MSKNSRNAADHAREADRMDRLAKDLDAQLSRAQARGDLAAVRRLTEDQSVAREQAAWHRAYS